MLVEHADGLIVLPGGPGTWDELWEMACARNLGMTTLPIVCVDVDGYYAPFRTMLENGYKHDLIKHKPDEIISFVSTSEEAVVWLEKEMSKPSRSPKPKLKRRLTKLKRSSFLSEPVTENYHHAAPASKAADEHSAHDASRRSETNWMHIGMSFIAGVSLGMLITVTKPHK
uniref:Cytokinin riboside 5'-monophosphate phosphoribohydrolase n=1 Tax=Craspedostauros australis TaxID=1486917 RepID=A0A7R9WN95_9STRA